MKSNQSMIACTPTNQDSRSMIENWEADKSIIECNTGSKGQIRGYICIFLKHLGQHLAKSFSSRILMNHNNDNNI